MKVKQCCPEMTDMVESYRLNDRGTIDLLEDPEYDSVWPDVNFCMYCGKKLEIEAERINDE